VVVAGVMVLGEVGVEGEKGETSSRLPNRQSFKKEH
jgi:hypothetical protein